jgi:3-carboxy-cis,cis-muconate cycloisomerase
VALSAALRVPALVSDKLTAMVQEHERGLGGWHAEWETLPEICTLTAGALSHLIQVVEGLELDAARMRANLDATDGLILAEAAAMALGEHIGRPRAHELVEQASRRASAQGHHLRDVLAGDPQVQAHLSSDDLDRLFDPLNYLGLAERLVERALAGSSAAPAPEGGATTSNKEGQGL